MAKEQTEELSAITKTYDYIVWLIPTVQKFPRDFRFVLGERIEATVLRVLELLLIGVWRKYALRREHDIGPRLFEQIASFENLWEAARRARRGKRYSPNGAGFPRQPGTRTPPGAR
jgi:hypothetical protein